ncbi:NPCBM/NEW2 domain-containing protein [Streptomyces sp. NPDC020489]|uniref:NPCBM/NEW2 domain-containing protein n=1 Tax=Streptomyces sp. NPDC020489 TaxID=3365077 RepID=UPI0037BCDF80
MDLTKKTDNDKGERRRRLRWGVIPRWVEVLAVCLATVAAGFFGGRVTVVQSDAPTPSATVTATITATPETVVDPKNEKDETEPPSDDPTTPDPSSPENASKVYLADLEPVEGDRSVQPITVHGEHYAKSITLTCSSSGTSVVYSTSGYTRLQAHAAIVADSPNAIGSVGTIKVTDAAGSQIGEDATIKSSKVTELSVDVTDQDQVEIACVMTKSGDEDGWYFYGGLGDATLS